jgi:hypothetical protein
MYDGRALREAGQALSFSDQVVVQIQGCAHVDTPGWYARNIHQLMPETAYRHINRIWVSWDPGKVSGGSRIPPAFAGLSYLPNISLPSRHAQ